MGRFDKAFKQPYELVATRLHSRGNAVNIYFNKNTERYIVGIDVTLDNINIGGNFGVREFSTKEDAYNELDNLVN